MIGAIIWQLPHKIDENHNMSNIPCKQGRIYWYIALNNNDYYDVSNKKYIISINRGSKRKPMLLLSAESLA